LIRLFRQHKVLLARGQSLDEEPRVSIARRSLFEQFPELAPRDLKGFADERHANAALG
jgi:hypothetical protein